METAGVGTLLFSGFFFFLLPRDSQLQTSTADFRVSITFPCVVGKRSGEICFFVLNFSTNWNTPPFDRVRFWGKKNLKQ